MTIIKKFDTEGQVKQKFPKFWVGLLSLFLLILVLIEIWVNNVSVSFGAKFENMKTLMDVLEIENQILLNEVAKNSALQSISSKSAELGFTTPSSIQYIR